MIDTFIMSTVIRNNDTDEILAGAELYRNEDTNRLYCINLKDNTRTDLCKYVMFSHGKFFCHKLKRKYESENAEVFLQFYHESDTPFVSYVNLGYKMCECRQYENPEECEVLND